MIPTKGKEKLRKRVRDYLEAGKTIDDLIRDFQHGIIPLSCDSDLVCGIGRLSTGCNDPFLVCCIVHDLEYIKKEMCQQDKTRYQVDREFYDCMTKHVESGNGSYARRNTYYGIVRSTAWIWWIF